MPKKKGIKSRCFFSGAEISLVFPYFGRKFTFFSRPRSQESDAFSQNMGCLLVLNDEKSGANVSRHVASRVEMNMYVCVMRQKILLSSLYLLWD